MSPSLSLHYFIFVSLSLSLYIYIYIYIYFTNLPWLARSVHATVSVFPLLYFCASLSLSLYLSVVLSFSFTSLPWLARSVHVIVSVFPFLYFCVCVSLSLSLSLSLSFFLCLKPVSLSKTCFFHISLSIPSYRSYFLSILVKSVIILLFLFVFHSVLVCQVISLNISLNWSPLSDFPDIYTRSLDIIIILHQA